MLILQYDETETGPRIRKTLTEKHGVRVSLVAKDAVRNLITRSYTSAAVDLYSYVRPSNGQSLWLIEARMYFPPDVELWRGWVVDEQPTARQIETIVALDLKAGDTIPED
jgi:hypothetical protein